MFWGLITIGLLLLGLSAYISLVEMVHFWDTREEYGYGYMIPAITLFLIWQRKDKLEYLQFTGSWIGILVLAGGVLITLVGQLSTLHSITQYGFVIAVIGGVYALLGRAAFRIIFVPLLLLFLMAPLPGFVFNNLSSQLQLISSEIGVAVIRLFGISVFLEGNVIDLGVYKLQVVEACSGVRYLIASFMVGTLFAYLNYRSTKRRLIFCLVAIAVPIVANWVRAYIIVMLGHLSGNTIAVGVDHLIYGWVFFGIVIGFMFFIGAKWSEPDGNRNAALPPPAAAAVSGRAAPMALHWIVAAATVAIAAAPHAAAWQLERTGAAASAPALALPDVPRWSAVDDPPLLTPAFAAPSAEVLQVYRQDDRAVTVHVAYYRHQGYGRKLVSSQNQLVSSEDRRWNRSTSGRRGVEAGGRVVEFASHELLGGRTPGATVRQRLDVRQVLWAGGRFTTSPQVATLLSVAGRLTGQGDDAAALTFYVEGEDAAATQRVLDDFLREHLGSFEARLQVARSVR